MSSARRTRLLAKVSGSGPLRVVFALTRVVWMFSAFVAVMVCAHGNATEGAPPTSAEILAKYGVKLDEPSLLYALQDSRVVVRGMAAAQLASDNARDAVPEIEAALSKEKTPRARYGMILSLFELGAPESEDRLGKYCEAGAPDYLQMPTANALAAKGDFRCLPVVAPLLSSKDTGEREFALLYVDQMTSPPSSEPAGMENALFADATEDPMPFLRELAAKAIQRSGSASLKARYRAASIQQRRLGPD